MRATQAGKGIFLAACFWLKNPLNISIGCFISKPPLLCDGVRSFGFVPKSNVIFAAVFHGNACTARMLRGGASSVLHEVDGGGEWLVTDKQTP